MTPADFLSDWQLKHISSGSPLADAAKLADQLIHDAALEGIDRDEIEVLAGKTLETYVADAIREAIEQELR